MSHGSHRARGLSSARLIAAAACATATAPASAEAPKPPAASTTANKPCAALQLSYRRSAAASVCPTAEVLREEILALLGWDPFQPDQP